MSFHLTTFNWPQGRYWKLWASEILMQRRPVK